MWANKLAIHAATNAKIYKGLGRRVEHQYKNTKLGITRGFTKYNKSLSLKNSSTTVTIDKNKNPIATEFTNCVFLKKELVDFDLILYVIFNGLNNL